LYCLEKKKEEKGVERKKGRKKGSGVFTDY
jgi:hypothetical protein